MFSIDNLNMLHFDLVISFLNVRHYIALCKRAQYILLCRRAQIHNVTLSNSSTQRYVGVMQYITLRKRSV